MPSPRLRCCVSLPRSRSFCFAACLLLPSLNCAALPEAKAQMSQQQLRFQIPPQSLATALIAFSHQSGWQVSAESTLLATHDSSRP
jgi:hypothetical protein